MTFVMSFILLWCSTHLIIRMYFLSPSDPSIALAIIRARVVETSGTLLVRIVLFTRILPFTDGVRLIVLPSVREQLSIGPIRLILLTPRLLLLDASALLLPEQLLLLIRPRGRRRCSLRRKPESPAVD